MACIYIMYTTATDIYILSENRRRLSNDNDNILVSEFRSISFVREHIVIVIRRYCTEQLSSDLKSKSDALGWYRTCTVASERRLNHVQYECVGQRQIWDDGEPCGTMVTNVEILSRSEWEEIESVGWKIRIGGVATHVFNAFASFRVREEIFREDDFRI